MKRPNINKIIIGQAEIRDRAIDYVYKWYRGNGWKVTHAKRKPYDLVARKGNNRRYIEVKGSMNQRSSFRALLTRNEKNYIDKCKVNHIHYRFHIVAGIGRHKILIHRWCTARKMPKPKPSGHYYITMNIK